MAATVVSLGLRPKRIPIKDPTFLHFHFFSSSTLSESNNADDRNTPPPPPQNRQGQSQFYRPSPVPPPHEKPSPATPPPMISFEELYKRRSENSIIVEASNKGGGASSSPFEAIRKSLRLLNLKNKNPTNGSSKNNHPANNNGGPTSLRKLIHDLNLPPVGQRTVIEGKEMREKKEGELPATRMECARSYSYVELGEKLRKLRPEGCKGVRDQFSFGELNERLLKLREAEEKEAQEKAVGVGFKDLRQSLMSLRMLSGEKNKRQTIFPSR